MTDDSKPGNGDEGESENRVPDTIASSSDTPGGVRGPGVIGGGSPQCEETAPRETTALVEEHPAIAPFSFLLGRWVGTGKGDYPTIEPFDFFQEVTFSHIGKPYLIYTSRTWRLATAEDGELARDDNGDLLRLQPLAVEAGFWRPQPEGKVEVLLSHPTGITEIYYGQLTGLNTIEMVTDAVARTETAKPYVAGKRLYGLVPNKAREGEKDLAYAFDMAAMGYPLTPHLWAVLQWDWIELHKLKPPGDSRASAGPTGQGRSARGSGVCLGLARRRHCKQPGPATRAHSAGAAAS